MLHRINRCTLLAAATAALLLVSALPAVAASAPPEAGPPGWLAKPRILEELWSALGHLFEEAATTESPEGLPVAIPAAAESDDGGGSDFDPNGLSSCGNESAVTLRDRTK